MNSLRPTNAVRRFAVAAITAVSLLLSTSLVASDIEVLWLGHATFRITTEEGKVIVIDPFLKKNPIVPSKYRDLEAIGPVDLILVTHGHFDHARDLPELAEITGAKVVGIWEYALNLVALGVLDGNNVVTPSTGGTFSPLGKNIKIAMVPADHSDSIDLEILGLKKAEDESSKFLTGGMAVGYIIELENGLTIYHAGDTGIFGDMELIRKLYKPDLALIPIGGFFTMDPERAAFAIKELIKPKQVIPIHYGTFPVINRTPEELKQYMGTSPIEILDVKPGEAVYY